MDEDELGPTLFELLNVEVLEAEAPWIHILWNGDKYWVKEETAEIIPDINQTLDVSFQLGLKN